MFLIVRLTDQVALEAYDPHPEHQRVVQNIINPIRADILASITRSEPGEAG